MSIEGRVKGLVFDMDGCLVDTETIYRVAWRKAFAKFAVEVPRTQINSWVGLGWDIISQEIDDLTKNHQLTLTIRQAREDIFFEMLAGGEVKLMPGALEILTYAKSQQLVVGLASSTFKEKGIKILEHFELKDFFDFIVFGDEVARRKPHGDIYVRAIELSGLPKEHLLAFEDSITGCQAANEAKLRTVWVPEKLSDSLVGNYPEMICEIVPSLEKAQIILENHLEK